MKILKQKLIIIGLLLGLIFPTTITQVSAVESIPLTKEEYKRKSGSELAELIKNKQVSVEQLVSLAYEIIAEENTNLNAVITMRKDEALAEAKQLDIQLQNNTNEDKPFYGVPILLKGLGHVYKTSDKSNGSMLYKNEVSKSDSSVAKQMKELGFVILGQTNYPEYGFRNITDSKLFGNAHNPWDLARNTGGSSGGSAGAIASGMVPIASASDAGGSIRIPASWTGLIGLKTSRAMTDKGKKDSSATAVSFPLTKTIADTKLLLNTLSTKKDELVQIADVKTLKIGYTLRSPMNTAVTEDAKNAVLDAVKFLKEQGFQVEEVEWPIDGRALMRDYTYGNLGYPLGSLSDKQLTKLFNKQEITKYDLDPLVWALGRTKVKDVDVKMNFKEDLKQYTKTMELFHQQYPILLSPTTAQVAPLNTDPYVTDEDKKQLYEIETLDLHERFELLVRQWEPMLKKTPFTQIANLTGEPALSLPTYLNKDGLPLGIMLNGKWGMDATLLELGQLFEDNHMFKMKPEITKQPEVVQENKEEVKENIKEEEKTEAIKEMKEEIKKEVSQEDVKPKVENNKLVKQKISINHNKDVTTPIQLKKAVPTNQFDYTIFFLLSSLGIVIYLRKYIANNPNID